MTAVAGILNKQGVAIAADSAVTVSTIDNRKVYNSANKIFTLSKYHPVGIAIYNNSEFMGIPWETLIKEYRKHLEKKSFQNLANYRNDFLKWLKDNDYFIDEQAYKNYLFLDFLSFVEALLNDLNNNEKGNLNKLSGKQYEEKLVNVINNYIKKVVPQCKKVESLKGINETRVKRQLEDFYKQIVRILNENLSIKIKGDKLKEPLLEAYKEFLKYDKFLQYSGLIFTGYGDSELFPRLLPVNVSIVVDNKLRFMFDEGKEAIIGGKNSSCIRPFAQTDVIDTVLRGISPELGTLSGNVFGNFLSQFIKEIKQIKGVTKNIGSQLDNLNIEKYVNSYQREFSKIIKQKYVQPLMGAVSHLSKEDLSEMAESLVYLTYLKRRFTMAEESVGGPVDVAVITKGDGFIWIKRKHYFDPELNQSFFQKYF